MEKVKRNAHIHTSFPLKRYYISRWYGVMASICGFALGAVVKARLIALAGLGTLDT